MKAPELFEESDLTGILPFYRRHVEDVLLPFWIRALDQEHGGIFTCFSNSGDRLLSPDKYSWSQGRYLWVGSKVAAMMAEGKLSGDAGIFADHLEKTALFLEHNVFLENGNCAFLLTESGDKKESIPGKGYDTSIFADCFVTLGLAGYAGLTKDTGRFERALELYRRIIDRVEKGHFRSEPYPVPDGYRAHSISMILLNVSQELAEIAGHMKHPEEKLLAKESLSFMQDVMVHFYQPDSTIAEFTTGNSDACKTLLLRHRNPGHAIESMWFVMRTAHRNNNSVIVHQAAQAVEKAIEFGWDIDFGGLFRFVDKTGGKPDGEKRNFPLEKMILDTWDMKLWWPHAEVLYATLLGYVLTGNENMMNLHFKCKNYVFKTFPNPDKDVGEWIQIRHRNGKPADQIVALPVKDPFHILRSLLLILDLPE